MRVENSFIGVEGVGEVTERRLWEAGVCHWDEFTPEPVGPTTADRIESFIDRGRRAIDRGEVAFFDRAFPSTSRWRLYETFRDRACAFDIETTGLDPRRDVVTAVTLHRDGETRTLVRGDDLTDDALEAAFEDAGLLLSFNGASFDVPFLETNFDVDLDRPHLDLMHTCRTLDLTGGLSTVERRVGIARDRPDIGGRDAVRLWHEHERGVDGALETLIAYNREDTENLVALIEAILPDLRPSAFPGEGPDGPRSEH